MIVGPGGREGGKKKSKAAKTYLSILSYGTNVFLKNIFLLVVKKGRGKKGKGLASAFFKFHEGKKRRKKESVGGGGGGRRGK